MMNSQESLWYVPDAVLERLSAKRRDNSWAEFLLCGLYCLVSVTALLIFSIAAFLRDENVYAMTIPGFALATCIIYGAIWFSEQLHLARHFVFALMGALCLFLFYSGGTENTGPLYYFIFPIVAVFLQGIRQGSTSVLSLLLISLIIQDTGAFGFSNERYSFVFMSRIYSVYIIISVLSFLFAWFREQAERELLVSDEDIEQIIHVDRLTGLCNRNFMERLLCLEHNRFKRYQNPFCLMAIRLDNTERIHQRYGTEHTNNLIDQIAKILMGTLRNEDIPARWESDVLLAMMPQCNLVEAGLMAERIREEIWRQTFMVGSIALSIGISEISDDLEEAITSAEENLRSAARDNGNSVVSSKAGGSASTMDKAVFDNLQQH